VRTTSHFSHSHRAAKETAMSAKFDRPAEIGEYDEGMQTLLQLVWGDGFLSPGGPEEIARLLEGSDIHGARVLDIGCGLGAIDLLLVQAHGAGEVTGIDLEPDLIQKAQARIAKTGLAHQIKLIQVTAGALPFANASFDVVFSKDSLVQIPDKPALFAEVRRVLVPGGRFIASDWLRGGSDRYSPEMLEYFRLEGITYNMASPEETALALTQAGFVDVAVKDRNAWYLALAKREAQAMRSEWFPQLEERLGAARAQHFVANWEQLVLVLARGELLPTHLKAVSP
jgi:ubiquinone/menaquinone biosynthesis C-methylase UbiE